MVVPTSIEYHSVDLLSADDAKSFPVISLSFLFLLLYHHLHHHVILYVCTFGSLLLWWRLVCMYPVLLLLLFVRSLLFLSHREFESTPTAKEKQQKSYFTTRETALIHKIVFLQTNEGPTNTPITFCRLLNGIYL